MTLSLVSTAAAPAEPSADPDVRFCKQCGCNHPIGEFYVNSYKHPNGRTYKSLYCRKTTKQATRKYKQQHRDKEWVYSLKARYGVSKETYEAMLAAQGGRCAGCGRPSSVFKKRLCVDHDHLTRKIRGLLCGDCNIVLGKAGDRSNNLRRLVDYLEHYERYYAERR